MRGRKSKGQTLGFRIHPDRRICLRIGPTEWRSRRISVSGPTIVVLDREGKVRDIFIGRQSYERLRKAGSMVVIGRVRIDRLH